VQYPFVLSYLMMMMMIIIIIYLTAKWAVARWQWLLCTYINMK